MKYRGSNCCVVFKRHFAAASHHSSCSALPVLELAAAASTENFAALAETGILAVPATSPGLAAEMLIVVACASRVACACSSGAAMVVRWFPSRSICPSRRRWCADEEASWVTWTIPLTRPWKAVCDGLRFGSWQFGSPLWEAMTRPGPATTEKVTLTALEAFVPVTRFPCASTTSARSRACESEQQKRVYPGTK